MMQDAHGKLNSGLLWQNWHSTTTRMTTTTNKQQQDSLLKQTVLKEETSAMLHLEHCFSVVLKLGYFGKQIRNTRKVLKCAGKGWRSVGPNV